MTNHATNAAERIVNPRCARAGDSLTMCTIVTVNESAKQLIEREVQTAIDAATAELTKDRDEWMEAFRDVVKQRDALERERDDLKCRAQSWDMLFAMIEAAHAAGLCEDVKGDDALNAYIDAWTKMKQRAEAAEKATAELRAENEQLKEQVKALEWEIDRRDMGAT